MGSCWSRGVVSSFAHDQGFLMSRTGYVIGAVAALLWIAVVVLGFIYSGDGAPIGIGLLMLLAIVTTLLFADRYRSGRSSRQR
jgi:hypothetical protein